MTIGALDYPADRLAPFGREKLVMEGNTEIERSYRLHACAKEPWTVDFIEALQAGDVLYDIGANVGSYTLLAAARGLQVVAIEPHFNSYATLCRNLAMNDLLHQVITLPLAVLEGEGLIWLHLHDTRSGSAGHELSPDARKRSTFHRQSVMAFPLDHLAELLGLPRPNALKIDTDGYEARVLQGAAQLLSSPALRLLMIELRLNQEAEITAWLSARGYEQTGRYAEREGHAIGDICYARFERPVPKAGRKGRRRP